MAEAIAADRPRLVYVSYDGAAEPLGESQVLAYLERLAPAMDVTLVSFEKPTDGHRLPALRERLTSAGVAWRPLRYHAHPPVLSTLSDVLRGAAAVRAELRRVPDAVVTARSDVPALMALLAQPRGPFVFDIRGFWADERVEAGFWRRGGAIDRIVRRVERQAYHRADAVVTLTHASVPAICEQLRDAVLVRVIPTCADVDAFARTPPTPRARLVWAGSLGPWYRFDLAVRMSRVVNAQLSVLTRQVKLAREEARGVEIKVDTVPTGTMPQVLFSGDVGLCLIRGTPSKVASAPTRLAEYLAAGMPVIVTAGVGDLEEVVETDRVGVVIRDEGDAGLLQAAERALALAADPDVRQRCRDAARRRFATDAGADDYLELYRELTCSAAAKDTGKPSAAR